MSSSEVGWGKNRTGVDVWMAWKIMDIWGNQPCAIFPRVFFQCGLLLFWTNREAVTEPSGRNVPDGLTDDLNPMASLVKSSVAIFNGESSSTHSGVSDWTVSLLMSGYNPWSGFTMWQKRKHRHIMQARQRGRVVWSPDFKSGNTEFSS